MSKWHEKLVAKVGLRIAGLVILFSAWAETNALHDLVKATAVSEATAPEMLLAGLIFVSVSAGMALIVMGGGLWKPVPISARWARRAPVVVSRDLEAALLAMTPAKGDNANPSRDAPYDGEISSVRHPHLSPSGRR